MRVAVLGSWHLGSVTAAGLAEAGHQVTVWDGDAARVAGLSVGRAPVAEPGLDEQLGRSLAAGVLRVTGDLADAVAGEPLIWITQDTHVRDDDTVDLSDLDALILRLGPLLEHGTAIAVSSQVPVGTCGRWWDQLQVAAAERGVTLAGMAYLPENLRLGAALNRFAHPDMVVIGSNTVPAGDQFEALLAFTGSSVLRTDLTSAELVKHAINSFLATTISFANEMASIAEIVGADAITVAAAMRLDERIGRKARVSPGLGFAGGTLARDVTTVIGIGRAADRPAVLAEAVLEVNRRHALWPLDRLRQAMDLDGATVGVLGLTYTVGTSTLRRSTAVPLVRALKAAGARVRAHDPQADLSELAEPLELVRAATPYGAADGCDALVLLTPWPEYLDLDWHAMAQAMRGRLVLDGPNVLDEIALADADFAVVGPGRTRQPRTRS